MQRIIASATTRASSQIWRSNIKQSTTAIYSTRRPILFTQHYRFYASSFDKVLQLVYEGTTEQSQQQQQQQNNVQQVVQLMENMLQNEYALKQEKIIDAVYYTALDTGNIGVVDYLLNNNYKEACMDDVELIVAAGKQTQMVKYLLDRLLPPDVEKGGITIRGLLTKIYTGSYIMTKFLIENYSTNPKQFFHTVNANHRATDTKNTILHLAAMNFRPDTIHYLLEEQQIFKIHVNERNVADYTPLEAMIHKVVYKKENPERGRLTPDLEARALQCCEILDKHNCLMLDDTTLERAGDKFMNILQAQYERAKKRYEDAAF
jgi:hypothetical protein